MPLPARGSDQWRPAVRRCSVSCASPWSGLLSPVASLAALLGLLGRAGLRLWQQLAPLLDQLAAIALGCDRAHEMALQFRTRVGQVLILILASKALKHARNQGLGVRRGRHLASG